MFAGLEFAERATLVGRASQDSPQTGAQLSWHGGGWGVSSGERSTTASVRRRRIKCWWQQILVAASVVEKGRRRATVRMSVGARSAE